MWVSLINRVAASFRCIFATRCFELNLTNIDSHLYSDLPDYSFIQTYERLSSYAKSNFSGSLS